MEDANGNGGSRYCRMIGERCEVGSINIDEQGGGKPSRMMNNKPSCSRLVKPSFRKVQVVYYLTKNGQLEHPHFMEVTHLLHHQLRLKDVMERLTLLRGRGMPSLYSWSCKRSYKNGYVWNDLGENDVICPTDGAEYVLKGSELIQGSTEKLQHLQLGRMPESPQNPSIFHSQRRLLASKRHVELVEVRHNKYEDEDEDNINGEETEDNANNYTTTNTPSWCSRGVSTDEIEFLQQQATESTQKTELTLDHESSPPSTTSCESNNTSKRFEDGDPVTESALSRNSVLLQLIACGGGSLGFNKGKSGGGGGGCGSSCVPVMKQNVQPPECMGPAAVVVAGRKSSSSSSLHRGVLCKTAAEAAVGDDQLADEIRCMSENPRFGNLQAEEKEYFSGSIVEAMNHEGRCGEIEPRLKKSSSYNEERSSKGPLEAADGEEEEEMKREKSAVNIGKCIPMKKFSSSSSKQQQQQQAKK